MLKEGLGVNEEGRAPLSSNYHNFNIVGSGIGDFGEEDGGKDEEVGEGKGKDGQRLQANRITTPGYTGGHGDEG